MEPFHVRSLGCNYIPGHSLLLALRSRRSSLITVQHFGVIGGGKLYIVVEKYGQFISIATFDTPDSLFDCAWSESNASHILTAHGGGGVRLWDLSSKAHPRLYAEHSAEVYAVDWNLISKDVFTSGAWDKFVKVRSTVFLSTSMFLL